MDRFHNGLDKYHTAEYVIYLSVIVFLAAVILAGALILPRGVFP